MKNNLTIKEDTSITLTKGKSLFGIDIYLKFQEF